MDQSRYDYNIAEHEEQGQIPQAFDYERMLEWDYRNGMSFRDGMSEIEHYVESVHTFMKNDRALIEARWKLCREYYDMDSKYKADKERLASIFAKTEQTSDDELQLDRASIIHPIVFEAVQQQQARLVEQMFGGGPKYVEVLGRNENDIPGAKIYEEIANYQQDWQIPTGDIADDVSNGGLVEGTGLVTRQWDHSRNCPDDECCDLLDYWFDPEGGYHHKDRWNVWRRYPTLGRLLQLRQAGVYHFTDKDMEAALGQRPDRKSRTSLKTDPKISSSRQLRTTPLDQQSNRYHEVVILDIFIQQEGIERWIYRANGLVIGITPNPIPKGNEGIFRFPCAIFNPIRKKGSKYGDSAVYRMLDAQDLVNSISYMMMGNLARSALGLLFGDPSAYEGDDAPKPGRINNMREPQKNLHLVQLPNIAPDAMNAISWIKHEVSDLVSGMSAPTRGQQVSANQTATSVNQLLEQSNYRMKSMARRGKYFRRDYDALGLLLNQTYLQPGDAFRISGEMGVWRPAEGADLHGVAGKDLMPTGYPITGSDAYFTQQALNEAAVIMQTGGNPTEFMRKYFESKYPGSIDVSMIYPDRERPGNDPVQENEWLAQGRWVALSPNDDDYRHITEHNSMALLLIQQGADQQIVGNIMTHLQQHQSRYQQVMADNPPAQGDQGVGTSGLNLQMPSADAKQPGEIEAQLGAGNAG